MKFFLVISLSFLICLSHCKIEIEEVDEFEEFEESLKNDADLKFKEDLPLTVDKAEAEITIEVCLEYNIIPMKYIIYEVIYIRMMTNLNILMMKKNLKVLIQKDYMLTIKILK